MQELYIPREHRMFPQFRLYVHFTRVVAIPIGIVMLASPTHTPPFRDEDEMDTSEFCECISLLSLIIVHT